MVMRLAVSAIVRTWTSSRLALLHIVIRVRLRRMLALRGVAGWPVRAATPTPAGLLRCAVTFDATGVKAIRAGWLWGAKGRAPALRAALLGPLAAGMGVCRGRRGA